MTASERARAAAEAWAASIGWERVKDGTTYLAVVDAYATGAAAEREAVLAVVSGRIVWHHDVCVRLADHPGIDCLEAMSAELEALK